MYVLVPAKCISRVVDLIGVDYNQKKSENERECQFRFWQNVSII
jgi:hypothetical protein